MKPQPAQPFVRVIRAHTVTRKGYVVLRLKVFRAVLRSHDYTSLIGVTIELLREIDSTEYAGVYEYEITIRGDDDRRQVVQHAILQAIRGNADDKRQLIIHANEMLLS